MRVSAEHAVGAARGGVLQRSISNLVAEAQPARAEAVEPTREPLLLAVKPLHRFIEALEEAAQQDVFVDEAVELVAVDGQVPLAAVLPYITLVHGHANQMRHDFGQAMIVVALYPDNPAAALGIGEPADAGEEIPVFRSEAAKIQIGKDISKQNQLPEIHGLEQAPRIIRPAYFRAKVEVGQNQRVAGRHHDRLRFRHGHERRVSVR